MSRGVAEGIFVFAPKSVVVDADSYAVAIRERCYHAGRRVIGRVGVPRVTGRRCPWINGPSGMLASGP